MSRRLAGLATLFLVVGLAVPVAAQEVLTVPETFDICHAAGLEGTTQFVDLTLPFPAVFGEAGHFFENGTPRAGHEQDILGPCPTTTTTTEEVTTTTLVTTTSEGETTTTEATTTSPPSIPTTVVEVNPICIDCNNATQADLMQLQGVDATLAQAIIDNRPYFSLQDLVTKGVMTPGQILLILAVNAGTGAFASDLCLQAVGVTTTTVVVSVPGNPTTSILGTVPPPSTVGTFDELPVTGSPVDPVPVGAAASGLIGLGLMILGWTMRKENG